MPEAQRIPGLTWRKLDLHVHTPASSDWVGPDPTPEEFIRAISNAGLDGIAVTDHNSAEWVDRLKRAAKDTTIAVFPGVEITAPGGERNVHILAIFDPTATADDVNDLLANAGIPSGERGSENALATKTVDQLIGLIAKHGALPILAHADSSSGVCAEMRGQARKRVMNHSRLAAVEVKNVLRMRKLLDGTDPNYRRALPVYRASDNRSPDGKGHSLSGIGARLTAFKLDMVDLEGLRQCFCDPEVRLRTDVDLGDVSEVAFPRIDRITVSGGFLAGQFDFHKGFNCIVGGKGVGKSLLVELIRFALSQPSSLEAIRGDHEGKLRELIDDEDTVTLNIVTKGGMELRVERKGTLDSIPVISRADGRRFEGDLAEIFPIMAYSQTEAIEIARNSEAQLELADQLLDLSSQRHAIRDLKQRVVELDRRLVGAAEARDRIVALRADLATDMERVAELDRLLSSDEHQHFVSLGPKRDTMEALQDAFNSLFAICDGAREDLLRLNVPEPPQTLSDDPAVRELGDLIESAKQIVEQALADGRSRLINSEKRFATLQSHWNDEFERKRSAYRAWVDEAGGDRPQLSSKRDRVAASIESTKSQLVQAEDEAEAYDEIVHLRTELLNELLAKRSEVFDARATKYAEIHERTDRRLKLEIAKGGNRRRFYEWLVEACRGSYVRSKDLQGVAESITPFELGRIAVWGDPVELAEATGIEDGLAARVMDALRQNLSLEQRLELQHSDLIEDAAQIQLLKPDGTYRALTEVSVGQKCTALLMIALSGDDVPILIDQPEDALDIASVYEDITVPIRTRKEQRQFILTTHNPTVAVAGDSDRFQILAADATRTALIAHGAIDREDVQREVVLHLEGGKKSFALKQLKLSRE